MFPSIGLDLDGVLDECPTFFRTLCNAWKGKIFVITYRSDRDKAIADLAELRIRYDELILVNSFEEKAEVIVKKGILCYFDDQPEILKHVPETVNVMLVRNGGNFDFADRKWLFSNNTAKLI